MTAYSPHHTLLWAAKRINIDTSPSYLVVVDQFGLELGSVEETEIFLIVGNYPDSREIVYSLESQNNAPIIQSVEPATVAPSEFTLQISGSGFDEGAVDEIYWKADWHLVGHGNVLESDATTLLSREPMQNAEPGVYIVTVKNPDGKLSNPVELRLSTPPEVSDVRASQTGAGTVDVYYRLGGGEAEPYDITMVASDDGGASWVVPVVSLSGDIGAQIPSAEVKHIAWQVAKDMPGVTSDRFQIRVMASPRGVALVHYDESGLFTVDTARVYDISVSLSYNESTGSIEVRASARDLASGTDVSSGDATFAVTEAGAELLSGSLAYDPSSMVWWASPFTFPHTGDYVLTVSLNGCVASKEFSTDQKSCIISGLILDSTGKPVQATSVDLYSAVTNTVIQTTSVTEASVGYQFDGVSYAWYYITVRHGLAQGDSARFYAGKPSYQIDIPIDDEKPRLLINTFGTIEFRLLNLAKRDVTEMSEMSSRVDEALYEYDAADNVVRIFSIAGGLLSLGASVKDTPELVGLVKETYRCSDSEATRLAKGILWIGKNVYEVHDVGEELAVQLRPLFLPVSDGGYEYGYHYVVVDGKREKRKNNFVSPDQLMSWDPFRRTESELSRAKSDFELHTVWIEPDPWFSFERAMSYLNDRRSRILDILLERISSSQVILYLPECDLNPDMPVSYQSTELLIHPSYLRFLHDETIIKKWVPWGKVVKTGISILGTVGHLTAVLSGGVSLVIDVGLIGTDQIIAQVEAHAREDLDSIWRSAGPNLVKDMRELREHLWAINRFIAGEIQQPRYLKTGASFGCSIDKIESIFSDLAIEVHEGVVTFDPRKAEVTLQVQVTNTGSPSDISVIAENYQSRRPREFALLSSKDILTSSAMCSVPDVGTGESKLVPVTLSLGETSLDCNYAQVWAHNGPWWRDYEFFNYSLGDWLTSTSSKSDLELTQAKSRALYAKGSSLTLQDAVDLSMRETYRQKLKLSTQDPVFEKSYIVSSDAQTLTVRLAQPFGDADLHIFEGDRHIGHNPVLDTDEIQILATYSGHVGMVEEISIPQAAGRTFRLRVELRDATSAGELPVVLCVMEQPFRPAIMVVTPTDIEVCAAPGENLTISSRVQEGGRQYPLEDVSVSASGMQSAVGHSLQAVGDTEFSVPLILASEERSFSFTFLVPADAESEYLGQIQINAKNAGEASQSVRIIVDGDGDTLPDAWEIIWFDSAESCETQSDTDADGMSNLEEYENNTNPKVSDTDGDGLNDGDEIVAGTDPLDPESLFRVTQLTLRESGLTL
ncbi:MAG: hypothetical protein Q8P50_06935, partial [Bacillota bacterium]|nr:hypothetical protein [Bacillota bacterium]